MQLRWEEVGTARGRGQGEVPEVGEATLKRQAAVPRLGCRRWMQLRWDVGFAQDLTVETSREVASVLPLAVEAKQQEAVGHMHCQEQVEVT